MIIILNIIAHMSDYTLQHYTLPHPRYHNGKEFYRHIPSDHPPTTVYSQPGLIVDVSDTINPRILWGNQSVESV